MAKQKIENLNIWKSGTNQIAAVFNCYSIYDNLIDEANFYVSLLDKDEINVLWEGNETINLSNYTIWKETGFTTDWLINYFCTKLNLTIKPTTKNEIS
jgi:hypothetical protein